MPESDLDPVDLDQPEYDPPDFDQPECDPDFLVESLGQADEDDGVLEDHTLLDSAPEQEPEPKSQVSTGIQSRTGIQAVPFASRVEQELILVFSVGEQPDQCSFNFQNPLSKTLGAAREFCQLVYPKMEQFKEQNLLLLGSDLEVCFEPFRELYSQQIFEQFDQSELQSVVQPLIRWTDYDQVLAVQIQLELKWPQLLKNPERVLTNALSFLHRFARQTPVRLVLGLSVQQVLDPQFRPVFNTLMDRVSDRQLLAAEGSGTDLLLPPENFDLVFVKQFRV